MSIRKNYFNFLFLLGKYLLLNTHKEGNGRKILNFVTSQASVYEAHDRTCTPPHMPKTSVRAI